MEVMMIHITLTSAKQSPADDPLGRTRYGYSPEMTPREIFDANHGYYVLGARADRERYALFAAPDKPGPNKVVLAVKITSIDPVPGKPGYRQIMGTLLEKGHPVFDSYVGKPSPVTGVRNPVTYIESPEDLRLCECGCGTEVSRGPFVSGHDQRALHERVAKIGTVTEFLRWFDQTYQNRGEVVNPAAPRLRYGQPRAFRHDDQQRDKYQWPQGLELSLYDDGRAKLSYQNGTVAVQDVSNIPAGKTRSSAHVTAIFTPNQDPAGQR
jgi:hypothetical protein